MSGTVWITLCFVLGRSHFPFVIGRDVQQCDRNTWRSILPSHITVSPWQLCCTPTISCWPACLCRERTFSRGLPYHVSISDNPQLPAYHAVRPHWAQSKHMKMADLLQRSNYPNQVKNLQGVAILGKEIASILRNGLSILPNTTWYISLGLILNLGCRIWLNKLHINEVINGHNSHCEVKDQRAMINYTTVIVLWY
jgi:hypothetical protein